MMNQTKITLKIYEPLLSAFNKKVEGSFLKRDAFLNHMIKSEVGHLENEMEGLRQSDAARLYISRKLKRLGTKTINVTVEKETARNLQKVVKQSNMVRDAFANRLILFLLSPDWLLEELDLPVYTTDEALRNSEGMPTSPLNGIDSILSDPLYYLRVAVNEYYNGKFYLLDLRPELEGFSCYKNDKYVPGTDEYKAEDESLMSLLEIFKDEKPTTQTKGVH